MIENTIMTIQNVHFIYLTILITFVKFEVYRVLKALSSGRLFIKKSKTYLISSST